MLAQKDWSAALALEKRMYLRLGEVQELTGEMADAMSRQDRVSVQMFLSMRQEQINELREIKDLLRKQCRALPPEDGERLRSVLSGTRRETGEGEALSTQVDRTRALLERVLQADQALSRRMGGKKSFYDG